MLVERVNRSVERGLRRSGSANRLQRRLTCDSDMRRLERHERRPRTRRVESELHAPDIGTAPGPLEEGRSVAERGFERERAGNNGEGEGKRQPERALGREAGPTSTEPGAGHRSSEADRERRPVDLERRDMAQTPQRSPRRAGGARYAATRASRRRLRRSTAAPSTRRSASRCDLRARVVDRPHRPQPRRSRCSSRLLPWDYLQRAGSKASGVCQAQAREPSPHSRRRTIRRDRAASAKARPPRDALRTRIRFGVGSSR